MPINWEEVISQPRCVSLPPWQQQVRDTAAELRVLYTDVQVRPLRSVIILEASDAEKTHNVRIPKPPSSVQAPNNDDEVDKENDDDKVDKEDDDDASTLPLARCVACDAIGLTGHLCDESECLDSGAIFADPV